MKKNAVAFSIFIAVIISVFLAFSIFGILYFYWGDVSAVKDSFSTVAGFFGGFATLGAAFIAAHLFNDWRDVQSGTNRSEHAKTTLRSLFQLQTMLDYYFEEVCTVATHYTSADIQKCFDLRKTFNDKYFELLTEFSINSLYYEAVYGESLSNLKTHEINDFNSYLFGINGFLSRVMNQNPISNEVDIKSYFNNAECAQKRFKETVVDEINKKLTPHIILKK